MKDNELIAEFMGLKPIRYEKVLEAFGKHRTVKSPIYQIKHNEYLPHQLGYDKSWDWIILVCSKFNSFPFELFNDNDQDNYVEYCARINSAVVLYEETPEKPFKILVEAIEWYNSVKK